MMRLVFCTWLLWGASLLAEEQDQWKNQEYRIIDGRESKDGDRTYQVSIQFDYGGGTQRSGSPVSDKKSHFCGGTYIGSGWVVTAAHCVQSQTPSHLKIVLGSTKLSDQTDPVFLVDFICKQNYDDKTKKNDIALIHLQDHSVSGDSSLHPVEPVDLCPRGRNITGDRCVVSGWGKKKASASTAPDQLMETKVKILSNGTCAAVFEHNYPYDMEDESMICAGGKSRDACQGDSGGPLVCDIDETRYLCGIVSWGIGCGKEGIPGVYTNVTTYENWIEDIQQLTEEKKFSERSEMCY